MKSLSCIGSR